MLNYIVQLNTFENLCAGILPPKAQLIYYKLFKWSNRFGLGEPFRLSNSVLMLDTGISNEGTFIANRNILKQRGFIEFKQGKKGSPTEYVLLDLQQFPYNTSVNIGVNTAVKTVVNPSVNPIVNPSVNPSVNTATLPIVLNKNKKGNKNKREKPPRHSYGEYQNVLLSDADIEKLKNEFPNDWQERIEAVSTYCKSFGKTYADYLATIRNWARRDKERNKSSPPQESESSIFSEAF